jgi:hypothetical protein
MVMGIKHLPTKISDQTSKNQVDYGWLPMKIMKSTPSSYLGRHKPCRSRPTAHLRTPSASCPRKAPRKPGAFRGAGWSRLRSWPQPGTQGWSPGVTIFLSKMAATWEYFAHFETQPDTLFCLHFAGKIMIHHGGWGLTQVRDTSWHLHILE